MASYNRVILMGNVTRDIELRYTNSGMAVTEVGLAVNDRRKNAAGEWVDEANYFDITMFGRTAEIAAEYLSKGSPVFIEGKLKYDTWEKDGQKRSKVHVICDRMQLIGSRGEASGGGGNGGGGARSSGSSSSSGGGSAPRPSSSPPQHRQQQEPDVYEDENIPF